MKTFLSIAFILVVQLAHAQADQVRVRFALTYHDAPLELGKKYLLAGQDSVLIETMRFYISDLALFQDGQRVAATEAHHHLVDAEDAETQTISIIRPLGERFNKITFQLGIDSITNVSGALGGDLDPTLGMYWAWQSGYINLKLEGKTAICPARNHVFQFHLGGYLQPFLNVQQIEIAVPTTKEIVIHVAVDQMLAQVNLTETYEVMRPCEKAMELALSFSKSFTLAK